MIFTVVDGNPPAVWVDLASVKIKASDRFELVGYYKTSIQPVKAEWTSSQEQGACIHLDYNNEMITKAAGVIGRFPLELCKYFL